MERGAWELDVAWVRDYARRHPNDGALVDCDKEDEGAVLDAVSEELGETGETIFAHSWDCHGPAHSGCNRVVKFDGRYFRDVEELGYAGPFKNLDDALATEELTTINGGCDVAITCTEPMPLPLPVD